MVSGSTGRSGLPNVCMYVGWIINSMYLLCMFYAFSIFYVICLFYVHIYIYIHYSMYVLCMFIPSLDSPNALVTRFLNR